MIASGGVLISNSCVSGLSVFCLHSVEQQPDPEGFVGNTVVSQQASPERCTAVTDGYYS